MERKEGEGVMSEEEVSQANETTQEEIALNNQQKAKPSSTTTTKVQSYPHMCESDKSIKT